MIINGTGTGATATAHLGGPFQSGIRKFVDTLPGLGPAGANNLGQYVPVARQTLTTYPGSDYYEIAVVQFSEKMHSDLPEHHRSGVMSRCQHHNVPGNHYPLNYPNGTNITNASGGPVFAVHKPHYLGPIIVANNGTPVTGQIQQLPADRCRRQSVHPGRYHRHGCRNGPSGNEYEPYQLHAEPGNTTPSWRCHPLDQRRDALPVDHPAR